MIAYNLPAVYYIYVTLYMFLFVYAVIRMHGLNTLHIHCVSEKTWCRTFCDNFINC